MKQLSKTVLNKIRNAKYIYSKEYNYQPGDILLCHSNYYILHSMSESDARVLDKNGVTTYLKKDDILGAIIRNEFPELFL